MTVYGGICQDIMLSGFHMVQYLRKESGSIQVTWVSPHATGQSRPTGRLTQSSPAGPGPPPDWAGDSDFTLNILETSDSLSEPIWILADLRCRMRTYDIMIAVSYLPDVGPPDSGRAYRRTS